MSASKPECSGSSGSWDDLDSLDISGSLDSLGKLVAEGSANDCC